jgi:hypothetical protein
MATAFETEVCTRCGGTGRFSFNGEHDRCYKCDGKNGARAYTKRGKAAKEYYLAKFNVHPSQVKVGEVISFPGIKKLTVEKIERTYYTSGRAAIFEGATIVGYKEFEIWHYTFTNKNGLSGSIQDHDGAKVRILPTQEENEAAIADALAYQDTLTKQGKPRKR